MRAASCVMLSLLVATANAHAGEIALGAIDYALDRLATRGQPVTITMAAFDGTSPVTGAAVKAVLLSPDGSISNFQLNDDGAAADHAVGDGLYSAFLVPGIVGEYSVTAPVSVGVIDTWSDGHLDTIQVASPFEPIALTPSGRGGLRMHVANANAGNLAGSRR